MSTRVIDSTTALQSFTQSLNSLGYGQGTVSTHIRFTQQFLDWAKRKGARVTDLSDEWLERISRHLVNRRCASPWSDEHAWRVGCVRGARLFLRHLQQVGIVVAAPKSMPEEPMLLTSFKQWMRQHRGTCEVTLYNYSRPICELLRLLGEDPAQFTAHRLRQFILERSRTVVRPPCNGALPLFAHLSAI